MSGTYVKKLEAFIEGKTFTRLSRPVRNRADAWCDACGSLEPRILFGLREEETKHYFFVGAECLREITRRGVVRRRYCKESGEVAFGLEMTRRRLEESRIANTTQPVQEVHRFDTTPNSDANMVSLEPQVSFWETPESYLALVRISDQGAWVWGSGEAPRFEDVWEGHGNGGVVLQRVPRERSQAMAECVRMASEDAWGKVQELKERRFRMPVPSDNGHHDWTGFWQAVRDLGLERDGVVELIDGLMPRDWLGEHAECSLEDLLKLVQEKHQQKLVMSSAGGNGGR